MYKACPICGTLSLWEDCPNCGYRFDNPEAPVEVDEDYEMP